MGDAILLNHVASVHFQIERLCDKNFIARDHHFSQSSGDRELHSDLRRQIAGVKDDCMLDKKSVSSILSLTSATGKKEYRHKNRRCVSTRTLNGIDRIGLVEYRACASNGLANKSVSRI